MNLISFFDSILRKRTRSDSTKTHFFYTNKFTKHDLVAPFMPYCLLFYWFEDNCKAVYETITHAALELLVEELWVEGVFRCCSELVATVDLDLMLW